MSHPLLRRIIVNYRELRIRLKAFRFFLILFLVVVGAGTVILQSRFHLPWTRAVYEAISLMFFATTLDYPTGKLFLEFMWIFYPMFGLLLVADGLSGIGVSLRLGDRTSKEWNLEMAKVMQDHVIIIGLGNLAKRTIQQLIENDQDILLIDLLTNPSKAELVELYQTKHEMPFIQGDATMDHVLHEANVTKAKAVMILIDDDLLNLKIALKVRKLNPKLDIIMRFFDIEFGAEITKELNIDILSTSKIAVEEFIAKIDGVQA